MAGLKDLGQSDFAKGQQQQQQATRNKVVSFQSRPAGRSVSRSSVARSFVSTKQLLSSDDSADWSW
jgi:hypothetical protein